MVGCITLKTIKDTFFVPGQKWHVVRSNDPAFVVHGNCGDTVMLPKNADTIREVIAVKSKEVVWKLPEGGTLHMEFPKASQIIDAWGGHLKFQYDNGAIVTLDLLPN